ncbi:MAG: hypothetical protein ABFE13_13240 [Phycisphaerales bacterium]
MITIAGTLSKGWMHRAVGVAFDHDYYFDPARRHAVDCLCNQYAAETFPDMTVFYSESNLGRIRYWAPDQVQIGGIQPNMILGMLLDAEFKPCADRDADIGPGCLANVEPSQLPAVGSLVEHDLVRLFDRQIAQTRSQSGGTLRPVPPFFWDASGRAAVHGVLTTALKLYGEAIFIDMMTEPPKCGRILQWIADAYVALCRHFARTADWPITDVHVGECSSCMVSPGMIQEFVVPATSAIARALGPVRFHSCGNSTRLLEVFAGIERLGSLDVGGETSLRRIREVFGNQIPVSIAPLPRDMSAESTTPILQWARRVLEENADGQLDFVYHIEPDYNVETIRALTHYLERQDNFRDMRLRR